MFCQHFQDLDQLCAQMVAEGRVVPFNSIRMHTDHRADNCLKKRARNGIIYKHLSTHFQLKYFEAGSSEYNPRCSAHRQIYAWLQKDKSQQLKSLELQSVRFLENLFDSKNERPEFVQLEKICISKMFFSSDASKDKLVLAQLLQSVPNLKKFDVKRVKGLEVIPEDKYELLSKFKFQYRSREDDALFQRMAERSLRPTDLEIALPDRDNNPYNRLSDVKDLCRIFVRTMSPLLFACHQSLKNLTITGIFPNISRFPLLPMSNLAKVKIINPTSLQSVLAIDFNKIMPKLEEIELRMEEWDSDDEEAEYDRQWFGDVGWCSWKKKITSFVKKEWPESSNPNRRTLPFSSNSTSRLKLTFCSADIDLSPLKFLAPNITSLELDLFQPPYLYEIFSEIWDFWPRLELVKIKGSGGEHERNYDADFCGIHEEEASYLRGQGEEFLKAIHIVPTKPSPLTMTSESSCKIIECPPVVSLTDRLSFTDLRKLSVDIRFWRSKDHPRMILISDVTKLLVVKRMRERGVCIRLRLRQQR